MTRIAVCLTGKLSAFSLMQAQLGWPLTNVPAVVMRDSFYIGPRDEQYSAAEGFLPVASSRAAAGRSAAWTLRGGVATDVLVRGAASPRAVPAARQLLNTTRDRGRVLYEQRGREECET